MGVSVEDVQKNIKEDFAYKRGGSAGDKAAIDADTAAQKKAIEDARKAQVDMIAADVAARMKGREASDSGAEAKLKEAREAWQKAKDEAIAATAKTEKEHKDRIPAGLGAAEGGSFSASGTFSSFGAWGLGTGGPVQEIAHHTQMTVEKLEALLRKAQSGGLVFE